MSCFNTLIRQFDHKSDIFFAQKDPADRAARILMFQQLFVIFYRSPQKRMKRFTSIYIAILFLIWIMANYVCHYMLVLFIFQPEK